MKKLFSIFHFPFSINQRGFTLIELLVVIVIIGVLSSLLMVNFVGIRQRARDAQRKADLRQIQSALEMYRADCGQYPTSDFVDILNNSTRWQADCGGQTNTYIETIPQEPAASQGYFYTYVSNTSTYQLWAYLEARSPSDPNCFDNRRLCKNSPEVWCNYCLRNP